MATHPAFEHLRAEHLSDSPVAQELRSGEPRLGFDEPLESAYAAEHLQRVQLRVRLWYSIGFVVSSLFAAVQAIRYGLGSVPFNLQVLLVLPCSAALAWISWSSAYQRYFLPVTRVLLPIKCVLIASFIAPLIGHGHDEELGSLTAYVLSAFSFSGLMFRTALFTACATVLSFAATLLVLGTVTAVSLKCVVLLIIITAMGATTYRDVERSARRNFLEDALIADLIDRDGLTGVMNRRALDSHLSRLWQQAQRDRCTLAVLMIDIDHFKAFNDTYGHQAGDAALRAVAQRLKSFARRPLDFAARYGGEEFVVLLYDVTLEHLRDVAERIRQSVESTTFAAISSADGPRVTVSVGAGLVEPMLDHTPQGALQFADEALYKAKRAGRNCIAVSGIEDYRYIKTGQFRGPQEAA